MKKEVKSCFFREQQRYTQEEIGKILGCDKEEQVVSFIRRLKEFGVLKRVKKDSVDLLELNNEDYSVAPVVLGDTESLYSFCFVGVLWINGFVVKCYPKYIQNDAQPTEKFKTVLQVIKRYNYKRENIIHLQNDGFNGSSFNMLALMLYFLNDYFEHGLYSNIQEITQTNGLGEILWDKTINETFAYIKENRPFYMELKTRKKINDETDFFSRLHQCILTACSKTLASQNLFDIFDDVAPVEFDGAELENFGEKDYLCYRIERELNVQFHSRKRLLLKSMYAFIKNENVIETNEHFSMFGTVSYHKIWEDVCKEVLCDMLHKRVCDVEELHSNSKTTLLEYICKPWWNNIMVTDTLIPDIVTVTKDIFAIFDAKYYSVTLTEKNINGQPGIESITKQYLYASAYKNLIGEWGDPYRKCVCNAFIFPKEQNENVVNAGGVTFGLFPNQAVHILFVEPTWFYQAYLSGTKCLMDLFEVIH